MVDLRKKRLRKGLEQLSNDQLEKVLSTNRMVLDEYYWSDGKC
jgi:hypothetical protein